MEERIISNNKYGNVLLICDNCGKEFRSFACYEKRKRKHRFCSKQCEGKYNSLNNSREEWRGGHIGKSTGYLYINVDGKQIGEHILVAEKKIGRRLHVNEVVHHINGNKLDNSPENLEVITRSEHATMHGHNRTKMVACLRCGKVRKHHGRGLCSNCYQYELLNGRIKNYELGGGNVVKIGVTE